MHKPLYAAFLALAATLSLATNAQAGKIVLANDEWPLSNTGFLYSPTAKTFATNLAQWFSDGDPGKFHAYSNNFSFTGSSLAAAIANTGNTWTTGLDINFDLQTLLNYDAIFLGGNPADNNVLIDYVNAGGNVYLAAGTGGWGKNNPAGEAAAWNQFLNYFNLGLASTWNTPINQNIPIDSSLPIFNQVKALFNDLGNGVFELDPSNPATASNNLYAVYDSSQIPVVTAPEPTPTSVSTATPEATENTPPEIITRHYTVPGTADPWLAGMPAGSTASASNGYPADVAFAQSPVILSDLPLIVGNLLTFNVFGSVNNTPSPSSLTPDGGSITYHFNGVENGISNISAPVNSLVGVFLGAEQPNFSTAPDLLNFGTQSSQNYLSLAPLVKQVFFIGDGRTNTGAVQKIIVPEGATQLALGTMDGHGWYNNWGAFDVEVTEQTSQQVPEPNSIIGSLVFGALCIGFRFKKKGNQKCEKSVLLATNFTGIGVIK